MTDSDNSLLREALAEALPRLDPIEPASERKIALRERLMQRARAEAAAPTTMNESVTIHADEGQWHVLVPGVQIKLLHADAWVKSFLLKIAPGGEVPAHEHPAADEECLVLEGEAYVGDLRLTAGAYHLARKGTLHAGNLRSVTGTTVLIHTGAGNPPRVASLRPQT
jgi:anti-sigma factor ChrR (cupin superfamily)